MKKRSIVLLMASIMVMSAVGCGASSAKADEQPKEEPVAPVTELSGTQTAVVMGDDWGPEGP